MTDLGSLLLPFDDVRWSELDPSADLRRLIASLASSTDDEWWELCGRVTNQTSRLAAAYAVMPHVAHVAAQNPARRRIALEVFGEVLWTHGPPCPAALRPAWAAALEVAKAFCAEGARGHATAPSGDGAISNAWPLEVSDAGVAYPLAGYLAVREHSFLAWLVVQVSNGELDIACPSCGDGLVASFEDVGVCLGALGVKADPSFTLPYRDAPLEDEAVELAVTLAREAGDPVFARHLRALDDAIECPRCGVTSKLLHFAQSNP